MEWKGAVQVMMTSVSAAKTAMLSFFDPGQVGCFVSVSVFLKR